MLTTFIISITAVLIDQATKLLVISKLKPVFDIPVWQDVLHLRYVENTGASFGMFAGSQLILIIVSSLASIGIIIFVLSKKVKMHLIGYISLGFILGGAVGNLIDRIRLSYVVDFIYVKIINFAIFNFADSCVTVGATLFCIYILFMHDKHIAKKEIISGDKV